MSTCYVHIDIPTLTQRKCGDCGGTFRVCNHLYVNEEIAEVVRNGKHTLVHVSCMKEGEQVA